jgi:hypothetical protein
VCVCAHACMSDSPGRTGCRHWHTPARSTLSRRSETTLCVHAGACVRLAGGELIPWFLVSAPCHPWGHPCESQAIGYWEALRVAHACLLSSGRGCSLVPRACAGRVSLAHVCLLGSDPAAAPHLNCTMCGCHRRLWLTISACRYLFMFRRLSLGAWRALHEGLA